MVVISGHLRLSGARLQVVVVVSQKLEKRSHVFGLEVDCLSELLLILTVAFNLTDHLEGLHFCKMRLQESQKLVELKVVLLGPEAGLQLGVQVHDPSVVSILQAVRLDVLPKSGDDARPCIFLNSQD